MTKKQTKQPVKSGKRRIPWPLILVGGVIILVLSLNEETSATRNYSYMQEIKELKEEIKRNQDSAQYYKMKREALLHSEADLEHLAREQYHMQRRTEDVFLIID